MRHRTKVSLKVLITTDSLILHVFKIACYIAQLDSIFNLQIARQYRLEKLKINDLIFFNLYKRCYTREVAAAHHSIIIIIHHLLIKIFEN